MPKGLRWEVKRFVGKIKTEKEMAKDENWKSIPAAKGGVPMKSWAERLFDGVEKMFPNFLHKMQEC
jgi:hypothetical protein